MRALNSEKSVINGLFQRFLQILARSSPGGESIRIWLHRMRGVRIGEGVWIGQDVILETSYPWLIEINDGVRISIRATILAHMREKRGVVIGKNVFIGPGSIILPGVTLGEGVVVAAGSVVTRPIEDRIFIRGNPATPVAICGVPLRHGISITEWSTKLRKY